jgi:NAD(P)-dependent dehydrogenase (short-subunit alcohol dehydrogenase family)
VLESHNVGGFRPPSGAGFWAGGPAELIQPDAATIDYGAAKAALVNLIKTVAQEFGPRGIHVNAVFSGPVSTDLWLGEHGVAETAAKVTFLASDRAANVTGANYVIDGGLHP